MSVVVRCSLMNGKYSSLPTAGVEITNWHSPVSHIAQRKCIDSESRRTFSCRNFKAESTPLIPHKFGLPPLCLKVSCHLPVQVTRFHCGSFHKRRLMHHSSLDTPCGAFNIGKFIRRLHRKPYASRRRLNVHVESENIWWSICSEEMTLIQRLLQEIFLFWIPLLTVLSTFGILTMCRNSYLPNSNRLPDVYFFLWRFSHCYGYKPFNQSCMWTYCHTFKSNARAADRHIPLRPLGTIMAHLSRPITGLNATSHVNRRYWLHHDSEAALVGLAILKGPVGSDAVPQHADSSPCHRDSSASKSHDRGRDKSGPMQQQQRQRKFNV